MMIVLAMAAAMAAGSDGAQAPAPAPAPPPAQAAGKPAPDPDKVICREEEVTGSKFTRRVCMTKANWEAQSRDAERFERRLNEVQTGAPPGGGT